MLVTPGTERHRTVVLVQPNASASQSVRPRSAAAADGWLSGRLIRRRSPRHFRGLLE